MMNLLGVLPEERRKVALLLLHYVWVVAVTIAGKSVRDAYFLSRFDRSVLPLMAVAAAVAVALSVALFTRVERRLHSTILVPLVSVIFAATLALLHFRLSGWVIPVLYVWMEVINVLTVLQFWLLAAEMLDPRQAKRLFPIIGGGGSLAAILIGPQLKPFSKAYGSDTLLWLVCALLVGAAVVALATTRLPRVPVVHMATAPGKKGRRRPASPYLRMISIIVVCAAVVSAIVDYQFKIISSSTLRTETDLVGFFGQFYATTGMSTLVLQFIVASRAFQRFGVVLVMAVLPLTLGLGSMSILFWPVLWSAVMARFSDQTFRFTLHNGGLELLWLPVSSALRSEFKPFINGSLKSITEGAVGIGMYLLLRFVSVAQLSLVALAFCGAWAFSLFKLRSLYVNELETAIANRRLPPEDLEVSANDALTVRTIDRALAEGDTIQKLFVLGLIEKIPLTPWARTLQRLLEEGEPEVKAQILQIAGHDRTIVTRETLKRLAATEGTEAIQAIRVIGTTNATDLRDVVARRMDDAQPAIRAAACGTLTRLNGSGTPGARQALENMLRSHTPAERAAALEESSRLDGVLTTTMLGAALADPSKEVRLKALQTAATHPCEDHAKLIAASLGDSTLYIAVRDALAALPAAAVLPVLTDQAGQQRPVNVRSAALRAMKICQAPTIHSVLLHEVDQHWPVLANQASESLLMVARRVPAPPDVEGLAQTRRSELVLTVSKLNEVLGVLPESEDTLLIRDYLEMSIAGLLPAVIRLASISQPGLPIETSIQTLHTRDRARLPFVLELLDTILTPAERQKISPLLESVKGRSRTAETISAEASSHLTAWLTESLDCEDEWVRAIVVDYILSGNSPIPFERIDWQRMSKSPLIKEVLASRICANPDLAHQLPQVAMADLPEEKSRMLTTLEKTILLKSVPLFKDIPGEELSRVAQIADEQTFNAKAEICKDGDQGDCLYVIVTGSVSIQKRGRELAVLNRAHSLGEMAVIDSAPRSADAIAIEDTSVLRVGQEQFLEIMQSNAQIMQGVVRMLLARLRKVDDQLADKVEAAAAVQSK